MPFPPPTENNQPTDPITNQYFNDDTDRMKYLKERADTVDSYIDQGVKTTDSPTFVKVTAPTIDNTTINTTTVNTTDINTNLVNSTSGFSSGDVVVKYLKLTGVTNAFGHVDVLTSINYDKILSISCYVKPSGVNIWRLLNDFNVTEKISNSIADTGYVFCLGGVNTANIPFRALITYEA